MSVDIDKPSGTSPCSGNILRDLNKSEDIVKAVSVQSINYCYLALGGIVVGYMQSWVRKGQPQLRLPRAGRVGTCTHVPPCPGPAVLGARCRTTSFPHPQEVSRGEPA